MTNEELKGQIDQINELIASGKAVKLRVTNEESSAHLVLDKKKVSRVKKATSIDRDEELKAADIDANPSLSLDLSAGDITDREIIDKVQKASQLALTLEIDDEMLPFVTLTHDDVNNVWILASDSSYTTQNHKVTAVEGFRTDLSSIPRIFWSLLEPAELSLAAPVFHDLIYRCAGDLPSKFGRIDPQNGFLFTRDKVDDLFLELMTKAGIPKWKRTAAFWAVRGFAGFAWKKQDDI